MTHPPHTLDRRRSAPRARFRITRRHVFTLLAIILLVELIVSAALALTVYAYGRSDYAQPADAIIVLGAGLNRNGMAGPALRRRSAHGAELYARGIAPVVICTGGFPYSQVRSEASACAELLQEAGVPADAILLEERSRSTEENAFYAGQIMQANGYDDAVLVSDTFHMLRAQWIFGTAGVTVYTSPATRRPPAWNYATSIAREVVALHWQVFKTALNLPVTYVPWL